MKVCFLLTLLLQAVAMAGAQSNVTVSCAATVPCVAPLAYCKYTAPKPDANGCVVGCGTLFCEPKDDCFGLFCPALPHYCKYGTPGNDTDGCAMSCGPQECGCPPEPVCPALAAGCSYESPVKDNNGCVVGCGLQKCMPVCPPACTNEYCKGKACAVGNKCRIQRPRTAFDANGCKLCIKALCQPKSRLLRQ
jgi:hypothetical protein